MKNSENKGHKGLAIAAVVLVILAAMAALGIYEINKYMDTHTWATIHISSDKTDEEQEYLKGDRITLSGAELTITKVTHDGTVSFDVSDGKLYDASGKSLTSDILHLGEEKHYSTDKYELTLCVKDNRYQ
mgnify:CR=1 FL=1